MSDRMAVSAMGAIFNRLAQRLWLRTTLCRLMALSFRIGFFVGIMLQKERRNRARRMFKLQTRAADAGQGKERE